MHAMSKGKAITYDLVNDYMFENKGARQSILNKVWDEDTINDKQFEVFLDNRLIPLNKKFPNCPTITDIRPIIVTLQLIKITEMRFTSKLRKSMIENLSRVQTGFVTEVNLVRLLSVLKERRKETNKM